MAFCFLVLHFNTGPTGLEARMKYTITIPITIDESY